MSPLSLIRSLLRRKNPWRIAGPETATRFSWTVSARCNYNCPHCFVPPEARRKYPGEIFTVQECVAAWENMYRQRGEGHIDISGGEPTIYPHFFEIVSQVSRFHLIGISTNLSFPVERALDQLNPRRVKIYPSFHPSEAEAGAFLRKLSILVKAGFQNCAMPNMVAYFFFFSRLETYLKDFAREGFQLFLQSYQGVHEGKRYPEAYSEEERQFLKPSIYQENVEFQLGLKNPMGTLCNAGHRYARVQNFGHAFRCAPEAELGPEHALGFFFNSDFTLLDQPIPCISDHCPCINEANLQIH